VEPATGAAESKQSTAGPVRNGSSESLFRVRGKLTPSVDFGIGIAGILAVVVIWCWLTYGGHIKPFFLPTPTAIWESYLEFIDRQWLVKAILGSTFRVLQSLLLVIAIGIPLGILMGAFAPVDAFLRKLVNSGKSVPTTGIVGLIVLWFGIEERAKIVFLFLGAIFYMILLVRSAVLSVSDEYIKVAHDIGAGSGQIIRKVLLPGALPQIWDAIAVCSGIMWTYIVLAEYINGNEEQMGLGYLLNIGSRTQDSGKVFGVLLLVAIISALTDYILGWIRRRYLNW
jgi:NitT/TauT family transport system permease protein